MKLHNPKRVLFFIMKLHSPIQVISDRSMNNLIGITKWVDVLNGESNSFYRFHHHCKNLKLV